VFYAFEALGVLERLHRPFFDALHRDRLKSRDAAPMNEWLQKNGVDVKKYDEAAKSFGVQSKVRRATQLSAAYRIDGTPALAVHGRYTVSAEQGRTQQGMLAIADYLIGVARKSK
jgi:protein dithiol oxidoreductase (disulfide-forming)